MNSPKLKSAFNISLSLISEIELFSVILSITSVSDFLVLKIKNIKGFLKRKVTKFGTSAKVDCPKEFLGKIVYLVMTDE